MLVLRQTNGKYGHTNLREIDSMHIKVFLNIDEKEHLVTSKSRRIQNDAKK